MLRELVLKYRENIVHVRTAADHMEEKLKAEILFLKEQIQAEQCLKENLEETLQLEIENCKEEIGEKDVLLVSWGWSSAGVVWSCPLRLPHPRAEQEARAPGMGK